MKLLFTAFALAIGSAAGFAAAADGKPLLLQPKAALAALPQVPTHTDAPFVMPTAPTEPELDLIPRRGDARDAQSRSSCSGANDLCYDPGSGRIVYKPARNFMPELPGLQRENISVKRDRVVFRYSF
jgi:hypothetical protein